MNALALARSANTDNVTAKGKVVVTMTDQER